MNYALLTGVSKGIGYELALIFAKNGQNLILVGRNERKLIQVADYLKINFKVKTLIIPVDLSHPGAADEIYKKVQEKSITAEYLVNNAGFYVKGTFYKTSWEDEQRLIQLICLNHAHLTKLFLPQMLNQKKGGILNVCSTGSFVPGPYNAVYCAAKSFMLSFSEAIAEEVSGSGVTVTALCPGGTNTDFQDLKARKTSFFFPLMEASIVAKAGYNALMRGKRVAIPGISNKMQVFFTRFMPRKMVVRLSALLVAK
jgi:short-subunit dehydrogenase